MATSGDSDSDSSGGCDPVTGLLALQGEVVYSFDVNNLHREVQRVLSRSPDEVHHKGRLVFPTFTYELNGDLEHYHDQVAGKVRVPNAASKKKNLLFYTNKLPSSPNGGLICNIHKEWVGKYKLLERHHGYIQWLFPIHAQGMSFESQPLQLHEREALQANPKAMKRLIKSYRLMLDFYGFELADEETGSLTKTAKYKPRFQNTCDHSHNYLRITRILKCLGLFGFEHYQSAFMAKIFEVMVFDGEMTRAAQSAANYWLGTLLVVDDRNALASLVNTYSKGRKKQPKPGSLKRKTSHQPPSITKESVAARFKRGSTAPSSNSLAEKGADTATAEDSRRSSPSSQQETHPHSDASKSPKSPESKPHKYSEEEQQESCPSDEEEQSEQQPAKDSDSADGDADGDTDGDADGDGDEQQRNEQETERDAMDSSCDTEDTATTP
eukprot:m.42759 g.42759  ORF g.42759 m.42759 type:complete len:439 (+) comp10733_c0_seq1:82-1398(+)